MSRSKLARAVRRCLWTTVLWTFVLIATNGTMRSESPTRKIVGPGATPCQRFNADIAANPASRRDYLAWAQGYKDVAGLFQQRQIDVAFDVALSAWISIPVPGAAEVAAFLYDANILDPRLAQARRGQKAAEAAHDHHVDRVGW